MVIVRHNEQTGIDSHASAFEDCIWSYVCRNAGLKAENKHCRRKRQCVSITPGLDEQTNLYTFMEDKMKRNFIPFFVFIITALLAACSCSLPFDDFPLVDIPSDIMPPSDSGKESILNAVLGIPLEWLESESSLAPLTVSGEYERMIITYDEKDDTYTITDIENKGVSFSFSLTDDAVLPVSLGDDLPFIVSIEDGRCRIVFENIYGEMVVYGW